MLYRVRTTLTDRPGSLARLAVHCGENGLNILALQIFPEIGNVVDELVLEASEDWSSRDIAAVVVGAGGAEVGVAPCTSRDLVDEPIRWLRAAERMVARPGERGRILDDLIGGSSTSWSFAENARVSALLDVLNAAGVVDAATVPDASETVGYEVLEDAVIASVGGSVVATGTLDADGTVTVTVSPDWRRRGVGRAVFVMIAGVARHAGHDEVVLVAPADDLAGETGDGSATLAMLDSLGLRGRIRMQGDLLRIRISLTDIRPLTPRSTTSVRR